jgi:hypothetical protein
MATVLKTFLLISSLFAFSDAIDLPSSKVNARKLSKNSCPPCDTTICPPTTTCDDSSTKSSAVDFGQSFTEVIITKDLVLNNEALVNAQLLKIDTDGDKVTDGLEGLVNFQLFDEERSGYEGEIVTVQSGFVNDHITIIAGSATLEFDFNSGNISDWGFTLFNEKNPEGLELSDEVASSIIKGSLNGSGLGTKAQFLLFKGFELFLKFMDSIDAEERRRNLIAFPNRKLKPWSECTGWQHFWYVARVVGACGVGSVVVALTCLAGLLAAGGTLGASVVLGCIGASSIEIAACTAAVALDACY